MDKENSAQAERILVLFERLLEQLVVFKPQERGELARRYAVTSTGLEKVYAYFRVFVAGQYEVSIGKKEELDCQSDQATWGI